MKILAEVCNGHFIAEVSQDEVEKMFHRWYSDPRFPKLVVGTEIDLGEAYEFKNDIKSACSAMLDASKRFGDAQETMLKFAEMVAERNPE